MDGAISYVKDLAEGTPEEVNALWAGLGYYRRARMLHAGAKYVVENHDGKLPSDRESLLKIPGIDLTQLVQSQALHSATAIRL